MDRNERLIENYEDAAFALLMDRLAREEGARLREENERLNNDPEAAVPEEIDRASLDTIRRAFKKRRRRSGSRGAWKIISRIAVAVVIFALLFVAAYATVPELRAYTLNVLIRNSDVESMLNLTDEDISGEVKEERLTLFGYSIPQAGIGLSLVDSGETSREAWIVYENARGATIRVNINKSRTGSFDTEDTDNTEEIEINEYEGLLIEKEDSVRIAWYDSNHERIIDVISQNLNKDYIISFAEGINYIEE